jgi:very-short-patch-repair endonuclease
VAKPKGWRPLADDEKQEIARRYAAGEGLDALAAEYHRSKDILKRTLTEAGVAIRPRGNLPGTVWPAERREAHRLATSTPEFAEKARAATLVRLSLARESPAVHTAIERRLQDALKVAGVGFRTQSLLLGRYLVDIELHQAPIVIEADGATHTLPRQKAKDASRDAALSAAGYRVFRFTGSKINADAAACVQQVVRACGLVPDEAPVYEIRTRFAGPNHPHWKGGKRDYTCEACGTVFQAQPKHRTSAHVYCSRQCAGDAKRGQLHTPEHRAKISASLTGQKRGPMSAETKAKLGAAVSAALKGKPKSPEHVAKVAAANRGKSRSAATRAKISATLKQRDPVKSDH